MPPAHPSADELLSLLRGPGLLIDLGAVRVAVHADVPELAAQIGAVYRHFAPTAADAFADVRIHMRRRRRAWRPLHPQVRLWCDGEEPFEPFPASAALPMLEWGANWLIGHRCNHLLLFHAGCLERDGLGLLLPATPGSGKSTLTAALSHRGWRLLSDEFGALDPEQRLLLPLLKPVALKNESIAVIARHIPDALVGPHFPGTRKGTVAHVAPQAAAVSRRHEPSRPAAVVLPQWLAGSETTLEPISPEDVFSALAFNAFNYQVLGETGFDAALALARQCPGWRLRYGDIDDAIGRLDAWWRTTVAGRNAIAS